MQRYFIIAPISPTIMAEKGTHKEWLGKRSGRGNFTRRGHRGRNYQNQRGVNEDGTDKQAVPTLKYGPKNNFVKFKERNFARHAWKNSVI